MSDNDVIFVREVRSSEEPEIDNIEPVESKNPDKRDDCMDVPKEIKWQLCLKARYRAAFLAKFASIFIRPGPDVTVGGSCGSCWIVTGYKAKKDKGGPRASYQVYLSGRDLRVTICAAVAAVVYRLITQAQAMNMDDDIKWPYNEGDEASHVCHFSNCINPDHITVEPKNVNQGLSNCCGAIYCPNCDVSLDSCRHEPPCVWSSWATYCSACGYAENTAHNNHQGM